MLYFILIMQSLKIFCSVEGCKVRNINPHGDIVKRKILFNASKEYFLSVSIIKYSFASVCIHTDCDCFFKTFTSSINSSKWGEKIHVTFFPNSDSAVPDDLRLYISKNIFTLHIKKYPKQ